MIDHKVENCKKLYKTDEIIQTCQPFKLTIPKNLLKLDELYEAAKVVVSVKKKRIH